MEKLKAIDLFAGIGGIRMGFDNAFGDAIETVFVSEWDEPAQKTYRANFKDDFEIAGDITQIDEKDIPAFDICLAGFPCQAFSMAGKHGGFNDDYKGRCRGTLFLDVVRICDHHKPKVIFCENVKGLTIHDKGRTFETIKSSFEEIGYTVYEKVLNSKNFGVPQNRERIYLVCIRNDLLPLVPSGFIFPEGSKEKVCIKDIMEPAPIPSKYYLSETYVQTLKDHRARHEAAGHGFGYVIRDINGISGTIVCGGMGREGNLIIDNREHSMVPTTHIKGEINKDGIRKMTPREWARLQGFPDSYILPLTDTHMYKQFGNSVSVPVIQAIAENIKGVLMPDTTNKTKNRGEIAEIYVFLKLLLEGKILLSDDTKATAARAFLDIISVIREEKEGEKYRYYPTNQERKINITLNGTLIKQVEENEFMRWMRFLWDCMSSETGKINDADIKQFLNSIFINNISSPSFKKTNFFGGVADIFVETMKDGINAEIGFSIKSDLKAGSTCFNASQDNTNFIYKLTGNMNDELMEQFNNTWTIKKDGTLKITPTGHYECDMLNRMKLLKENQIDLKFVSPACIQANNNLIMSGGNEFPSIIGELLKYYFYESGKSNIYITDGLNYLVNKNPAGYNLDAAHLDTMYRKKIGDFLYNVAMGLRLGNEWNGTNDISGGYIIVHNDGTVTAYHTTVADQFKGFLLRRLQLEKPSAFRHKYMTIYKENGEYYVKLNLQCRFNLEKE